MNGASAEKARGFWSLAVTSLYGMALDEYLALLRKHRFAVDHLPAPAAFMTLSCTLTSLIRPTKRGVWSRDSRRRIQEPCSFSDTGVAARRTCTTCWPWTSGSRIPTCGALSTRHLSHHRAVLGYVKLVSRRRAHRHYGPRRRLPFEDESPPSSPCAAVLGRRLPQGYGAYDPT